VESWSKVVVLSLGGAMGANARYWAGVWINRWATAPFPWATLAINVSGSFAIGFLTLALSRWLPHPNYRLLLVVGLLGGYTTFSTFEFESLTLWERGEWRLSLANMGGSVLAGFLAVWLGASVGRAVTIPASERRPPPTAAQPVPGTSEAGAGSNGPDQPSGGRTDEAIRRPT
jgi:CrcB protein